MKTHRRTVALLAAPGIRAARDVYTSVPSDALRVAVLVEIRLPLPRWPARSCGCAGLTRT